MAESCVATITRMEVIEAPAEHAGQLPFVVRCKGASMRSSSVEFGALFTAKSKAESTTGDGKGVPTAARLCLRSSVKDETVRSSGDDSAVTFAVGPAAFLAADKYMVVDGNALDAAMAQRCGSYGHRHQGDYALGERLAYDSHTFVAYAHMYGMQLDGVDGIQSGSRAAVVCIQRNDTASLILACEMFKCTTTGGVTSCALAGREEVCGDDVKGSVSMIRSTVRNFALPKQGKDGKPLFFEPMAAFMHRTGNKATIDTSSPYVAFVCSPEYVGIMTSIANECRRKFVEKLDPSIDASSLCMLCDIELNPVCPIAPVSVSPTADVSDIEAKRSKILRYIKPSAREARPLVITLSMFVHGQ